MTLPVNKLEAYDLLRRWRDVETLLRVRAELFPVVFDLEGVIGRVEPPHVAVMVRGHGTVEFLLENEWGLAFGEPSDISEATGRSSSDEKQYRFGEILIAVKVDGSKHSIMFMEILE
jgi:hypothetical protein